jgi:peptidoglycan/xylan/chitin deacetylase (PgdA/CDA1 family)
MYHAVLSDRAEPAPGREEGAALYDVRAEAFAAQLAHLAAAGARVLAPREEDAAAPAVRITFDDGERNNFVEAFPALRARGFAASFFVVPRRIATAGYMTWDELAALAAAGMEIGAHGLTHRILVGLPARDLEEELAGARRALEDRLGVEVTSMSVPRGFYDARVLGAARAAGYRRVYVSRRAGGSEDGTIERVAVKATWTVDRFALAARGETPIGERLFQVATGRAKALLGARAYDRLRSAILGAGRARR